MWYKRITFFICFIIGESIVYVMQMSNNLQDLTLTLKIHLFFLGVILYPVS